MKEDDEGIRFHTLLTAGMHCGGRIWLEKRWRRVCSWAAAPLFMVAACRASRAAQEETKGVAQGLPRHGVGRG
jgi:hypothetical protein